MRGNGRIRQKAKRASPMNNNNEGSQVVERQIDRKPNKMMIKSDGSGWMICQNAQEQNQHVTFEPIF